MKRSNDLESKYSDASKTLIDRRRFLVSAGLAAAGSAFAGPLAGCGGFDFVIPCLGPAAAPTPVAGMTYIRASEIGCALDCNLNNGRNKLTGGAATDDGPRINAAMAGASAKNPITLILDGSALISGLFMPAGGYWNIAGLGCGTGFVIKPGTNNDGIHNGPPNAATPTDPGPPAPARGANVSLRNFTVNGNAGNGRDGDSTTGQVQGSTVKDLWYFSINLMNLDNIVIENVVVVKSPAYHFRLSNVGHAIVTGCVMKSYSNSTDGVHLDGPANDIAISNCNFTTGDDAIALNAPEGYSGNISRVTVSNCVFNSFSLMRLYTLFQNGAANRFNIDTVSVSGCTGSMVEAGFLIGLCEGSNPNSVNGLTVSDCTLTAPVVLDIAENFGDITLNNVTLIPSQSGDVALLRPSPIYKNVTYTGSSLSVNNCTIQRHNGAATPVVRLEYDSVIEALSLNGFTVQDAGHHSPVPELVDIGSGSVGQLVITSVESSNIEAPVSPGSWPSIGSVSGTGVLATGWEFPDAVMANQVPFLSANTGVPSIKIAGVVEPYTGPEEG